MQNYLLYYNGKSNEMLRNSFIIHRVKFIMQEFFQTHSYLSQIFGFLAIAVGILMYQFKKHKTIMILMTLNAALWCLHYGSLWLFTPVAMNFINLARSYVCSFDNKFARSKAVPVVFIVLSLALTVFTWQGAMGYFDSCVFCFRNRRRLAEKSADSQSFKCPRLPLLAAV